MVKKWLGVCVFEGIYGESTLPCDWIEFDMATRSAYLKGTPVGELKCRDSYC